MAIASPCPVCGVLWYEAKGKSSHLGAVDTVRIFMGFWGLMGRE